MGLQSDDKLSLAPLRDVLLANSGNTTDIYIVVSCEFEGDVSLRKLNRIQSGANGNSPRFLIQERHSTVVRKLEQTEMGSVALKGDTDCLRFPPFRATMEADAEGEGDVDLKTLVSEYECFLCCVPSAPCR